jgi:hypothetical protein
MAYERYSAHSAISRLLQKFFIEPASTKRMSRPIPEPLRGLAAKAFADHSQRVHGTATPPRSTEL